MQRPKYRIVPTKSFLKDLKKIDPKIAELALEKKNQLAINPYIGKKLTDMPFGIWRIRVTRNYRIRYDIEGNEVILHMIKHRKDIYKK